MLYPIFSALKEQLNNPTNDIGGNPREGLNLPGEWFNMQYEGTMVNDKGFFVAFPDELPFTAASKQMRRAPVKIRLHIYSKALQTHDGISDQQVQDHEAIATKALELLDGFTPENGACKRLTFNGWRHWHRWKGWMVTFVEFEAKIEI